MLLEALMYIVQTVWGYADKKVDIPVEDWVSGLFFAL
jgi:hypothetical protein